MTSYRLTQGIPYLLAISLLVAASGCNDEIGVWNASNQSRFERGVAQKIVLNGRNTLDVLSGTGSITVTGHDVTDCNLVATIVAKAPANERHMRQWFRQSARVPDRRPPRGQERQRIG
jgi:hypothetical protein